jgi:hypothetical protein
MVEPMKSVQRSHGHVTTHTVTAKVGAKEPMTRAANATRVRSINAAVKPTTADVVPRRRNSGTSFHGPPPVAAAIL